MSEDLKLIIGCYLLQWITLFFVVRFVKRKQSILILHFNVQFVYTLFFILILDQAEAYLLFL